MKTIEELSEITGRTIDDLKDEIGKIMELSILSDFPESERPKEALRILNNRRRKAIAARANTIEEEFILIHKDPVKEVTQKTGNVQELCTGLGFVVLDRDKGGKSKNSTIGLFESWAQDARSLEDIEPGDLCMGVLSLGKKGKNYQKFAVQKAEIKAKNKVPSLDVIKKKLKMVSNTKQMKARLGQGIYYVDGDILRSFRGMSDGGKEYGVYNLALEGMSDTELEETGGLAVWVSEVKWADDSHIVVVCETVKGKKSGKITCSGHAVIPIHAWEDSDLEGEEGYYDEDEEIIDEVTTDEYGYEEEGDLGPDEFKGSGEPEPEPEPSGSDRGIEDGPKEPQKPRKEKDDEGEDFFT